MAVAGSAVAGLAVAGSVAGSVAALEEMASQMEGSTEEGCAALGSGMVLAVVSAAGLERMDSAVVSVEGWVVAAEGESAEAGLVSWWVGGWVVG